MPRKIENIWTRTKNLFIKSETLNQLSYVSINFLNTPRKGKNTHKLHVVNSFITAVEEKLHRKRGKKKGIGIGKGLLRKRRREKRGSANAHLKKPHKAPNKNKKQKSTLKVRTAKKKKNFYLLLHSG